MFKVIFPPAQWLSGYTPKILRGDSIAGITLAVSCIPVSLAYASLAGLPPHYGVYGFLLGGAMYALFGTGRQLAIGATSSVSLLIGVTLSTLSNGDPQRWIDLSSLTTTMFAAICLLAYLFKLSGIVNFISDTVLLGFKAGAACVIAISQLPKLFGLAGGGGDSFEKLGVFFQQLPQTNLTVLLIGVIALGTLIAGENFLPGRPVAIAVVIISILVYTLGSWASVGVTTVGFIPAGLPSLHLPNFSASDIRSVLPLAFGCFLLSYIESYSAAKALGQQNGYDIDPRQELLALGASNLSSSLGQGYVVSGGLSQSVINERAGAKTPLALVFASAAIVVCLLFLTGMLENLPNVILAAILLNSVKGLFDYAELRRLFTASRSDFYIALITISGVIVLGVLQGIILAALLTLLMLIRMTSTPGVAFLGRIPGTSRYSDLERHPDNESITGVLIFRVESSLFYFNADHVYRQVWSKVSATDGLRAVIWDLGSSPYVDISGARLIKRLSLELKAKGIELKIAEARAGVRDRLRTEEAEHLLGPISRKDSVNDLVMSQTLSKT